ncbi:IPT/TIG domain-containing protein [Leeuwenhoekiella marinoflava]|uniref:IPT/TIG domain-containing protein n=2 Tax=Leeuwenhoekiella marinoflava TaxID=988 RepID=A0A4Q0PFZ2_9FLAO|nr:IPT/TIG domain-containing protein [Leeuwenhoekiella marinoflava]RXG25900.1 IPT/TIG domain-containing protein [Leeuwenhoekiella marinoflava]SHF28949.1 IPT/TIG domain-containing protein [Leeuwenhoekiella marinoflava DSM 3653]
MYLNKIYKTRSLQVLCVAIAFVSMLFNGCQNDDEEEMVFPPFDASVPVEVTGFTPESGGAGQRLVIYGKNFGTDVDLVSVLVGGKKAVVISVNGESIYCLIPKQAFGGDIEVRIGQEENKVVAYADANFDYQRKMVVSNLIGYKNDRGDEPWKDGRFTAENDTDRASGFWEPSFIKFDPLNPKHLWAVFDFNNGLYLINFEDSTVTKKRSDFDRPRSIDFTNDGKYMIIAEDRGGENDRATYRLSRDKDWQDREIITRYRQCNGASVHPVNGELYFNSYEKGQFFRFDLNKYFDEGLGDKDYEQLFVVQDPGWEYKTFIHPSGNYAYIVIINKHYILRVDYNWEKKQFNQPYLVCGRLGSAGYQDGVGSGVRLNTPYQGVFVKNEDYVEAGKADEYDFYFTEQYNHDIRILTPEGSVTTFAGRGSSSINPDPWGYVNGDLREEARFDQPTGIAYEEEEGAFYIGDKSNHRFRKIALETKDE